MFGFLFWLQGIKSESNALMLCFSQQLFIVNTEKSPETRTGTQVSSSSRKCCNLLGPTSSTSSSQLLCFCRGSHGEAFQPSPSTTSACSPGCRTWIPCLPNTENPLDLLTVWEEESHTHIPVDIKLTLCLMCTVQLPLSLWVKFHEQTEHVKTSASASEQKIFWKCMKPSLCLEISTSELICWAGSTPQGVRPLTWQASPT